MPLRALLSVGVLATTIFAAGPAARARGHSPNVWERAQDPTMAFGDAVHREVQGLLLVADHLHWHSPMGQEQLGRARHLLEAIQADSAPDVRLRFDFGQVVARLGDDKRAARVLESALAGAPDHPLATSAYFDLGICYAKLSRPDEEIAAYDEYLRRETSLVNRARALSNRADAHMVQGRLALAITDYRAALLLTPDMVPGHWGLAVALDRAGDAPAALSEARVAITYDPLDQQLSSPNVFFMPAYDHFWYEGIGAMARAQQIDDMPTAILWWETAVAKWAEYTAFATSDDRWLVLAKAHQASCQRKLDQAKKAAARAPKHRRPPVEDP